MEVFFSYLTMPQEIQLMMASQVRLEFYEISPSILKCRKQVENKVFGSQETGSC